MADIKIAVLNGSTVVADAEVPPVVAALQKQVHDHYGPAWGCDADLAYVPKGQTPPAGTWWLAILDNSDQAGALGYHDLTTEGLPLGKVFAATDLQYNQQWSVTASHELLEMLGDPDINLTVFVQKDETSGRLYAYENCDAVEADDLGYRIDGVLVSDFVFPAWFESFRQPKSTQFDYQKRVTKPFDLLPGGYIGVFDVGSGTGWQQITAQETRVTNQMRAPIGSRRERRRTPRNHWLRSDPKR